MKTLEGNIAVVTGGNIELARPTKMVWSWKGTDEGEPTRVEFHLDRIVIGTRLKLIHTGDTDPTMLELLGQGWPKRLDALRTHLNR